MKTMAQEVKKQNYQIGQIVYIMSDKAEAIVPAIVVEELIHKRLDGDSISWKVAVGPVEKKKIVASDDLSGEIYTSLEEIRNVMSARLSDYIDNLLSKAVKRTESWYGKQLPKPTSESLSLQEDGKIDPVSLVESIEGRENYDNFVTTPGQEVFAKQQPPPRQQQQQVSAMDNFGEGIKITAPINTGPLDPNKFIGIESSDPREQMRARLKAAVTVPDEEFSDQPTGQEDQRDYMVTSDGKKIPIRYND